MAPISSSSPVRYVSPELMNLTMNSSHESSLSWRAEIMKPFSSRTAISSDVYGVRYVLDIPDPDDRVIKVSELVLIGLQKLYEHKPDLNATPSKTCVNLIINQDSGVIYNKLGDTVIDNLAYMRNVCFYNDRSDMAKMESEVFGLRSENVRAIVQLADQFLVSFLKKEERGIACYELPNITRSLASFAEEATKTTSSQAPIDTLGNNKAYIIDRLNFLFHSLTFFQKNLFPDEEQTLIDNRISIIAKTVETSLPAVIINIIAIYDLSKIINPKTSISSSPTGVSLNPANSDKSNSHQASTNRIKTEKTSKTCIIL